MDELNLTSSVDVRMKYLEDLTRQLGEQIRTLKSLVTTEVSDLKTVTQQQIAEVKQIVMHQDRIYQERIRRLEARMEQLSEFAMQLVRTTGQGAAALHLLTAPATEESMFAAAAASPSRAAQQQPPSQPAAPVNVSQGTIASADENVIPGTSFFDRAAPTVAKFRFKIDAIYDFYTTSNIQVFHPAMTLGHFTKFCRDCKLSDLHLLTSGGSSTTTELLWMTVIRKIGPKRLRKKDRSFSPTPQIVAGKAGTATTTSFLHASEEKDKPNFAMERLQEISKDVFPLVLAVLASEKIGKQRPDLSPDLMLETFLVVDVFPNVDLKLEAARGGTLLEPHQHQLLVSEAEAGAQGASPGRADLAARSIQSYKTPGVRSLMSEYHLKLKEAFFSSIAKVQRYTDKAMALDGFVEFVKSHDLLPLITKPDVRAIFMACCAIECAKNPDAKPDTISIPSFMLSIYHLAERIYGDPLFSDKYPNPEARTRKLLAKLFLLA